MRKRSGPRRIELPRDDIVRAYGEGESLDELAVKYGVSKATIRRRTRAWGVELRRVGPIPLIARRLYARFNDDGVRLRILQLEESIAAKQVEVGKREAELKRVQEKVPAKASSVVARLKKVDAELRDFEEELMKLQEVA